MAFGVLAKTPFGFRETAAARMASPACAASDGASARGDDVRADRVYADGRAGLRCGDHTGAACDYAPEGGPPGIRRSCGGSRSRSANAAMTHRCDAPNDPTRSARARPRRRPPEPPPSSDARLTVRGHGARLGSPAARGNRLCAFVLPFVSQ